MSLCLIWFSWSSKGTKRDWVLDGFTWILKGAKRYCFSVNFYEFWTEGKETGTSLFFMIFSNLFLIMSLKELLQSVVAKSPILESHQHQVLRRMAFLGKLKVSEHFTDFTDDWPWPCAREFGFPMIVRQTVFDTFPLCQSFYE